MKEKIRKDRQELGEIWRKDYSPRARKVVQIVLILGIAFLWTFLVVNLHREGKSPVWAISEASVRVVTVGVVGVGYLVFAYILLDVWMTTPHAAMEKKAEM